MHVADVMRTMEIVITVMTGVVITAAITTYGIGLWGT